MGRKSIIPNGLAGNTISARVISILYDTVRRRQKEKVTSVGVIMNLDRALFPFVALAIVANLPSIGFSQSPTKTLPTATVPSKSLPTTNRIVRTFNATGVRKVILRAGDAEGVVVKIVPSGQSITMSGIPEGGALGYHSPDPNWRETPASKWGLNFQAKSFGPTLLNSTDNEISYIHHQYKLGSLTITIPEGVEVVKENRKLTGEGMPDLAPPVER